MKMKIITIIISAFFFVMFLIFIYLLGHTQRSALAWRKMDGTILSTTENLTEIVTDDGNVWQVENFPCRVGTRCTVTFNTQKTDDPTDDTITEVVTYISFN